MNIRDIFITLRYKISYGSTVDGTISGTSSCGKREKSYRK